MALLVSVLPQSVEFVCFDVWIHVMKGLYVDIRRNKDFPGFSHFHRFKNPLKASRHYCKPKEVHVVHIIDPALQFNLPKS